MMRTLAQTGNGWMTFKDAANRTANQTAEPGRVVHSSNLCTEILEVTDDGETAVCNLGSVNLAAHLGAEPADDMDWERLDATVRTAVTFLDRVVDINFYPTEQAGRSNSRWRPVGLGVMGLQDVFFQLRLPFDSPRRARAVHEDRRADHAGRVRGVLRPRRARTARCPPGPQTRTARGVLHPDHYERRAPLAGALGRRCAPGSPRPACATPCCWRSRRPRPSPRSPVSTSASSRRSPTSSSARRCQRRVPPGQRLPGGRSSSGSACGTRGPVRRCARPTARCRASTGSPRRCASCTARRGRSRSARLIDMAAARTPFLDQSQSLNLFLETPTIGKLSSMYAYAWKQGLKTTYYLRSRPATRIAARRRPAQRGRRRRRRSRTAGLAPRRRRRDRLLPGEPRVLRGLPVMTAAPHSGEDGTGKNLLDPGFELTLRPMRYPDFYERYRDAIKNTWTVEEVDLHSDVADLAKLIPGRAAHDRPAGRVLRHRRLDRLQQPGADALQAHQLPRGAAVPVAAAVRGGRARPVLSDAARHLPARPGRPGGGLRRGREHPLHPREGAVLLPLDGLGREDRPAGDAGRTAVASCST